MYDEIAMNIRNKDRNKEFKESIESLGQLGVPFIDSDGNYRPLIDIIQDLAKTFEECCND